MTIALGLLCSDGVVLGADLQYSTDFIKTAGRKIFIVPSGPNYKIIVAGSGNSDSVKKCVEVIGDHLLDQDSSPTLRELKEQIEACLAKVYREHLDFAPEEQRRDLDCELILGVWMESQVYLFRTNRTMLIEEREYACVGMGLYLAHYALAQLLHLALSVDLGSQIVTHVIAASKDYIEGIGKGTDIHILRNDGFHESLIKPEKKKVEEQFEQLFKAFRGIVSCAETWNSQDTLELWIAAIKRAVEALRNSQEEHRERIRLLVERIKEAEANRQFPKGDPSHPPPSPESP